MDLVPQESKMFKLGKEWLAERDLPRIMQEMNEHLHSHCWSCGATGQLTQVENQQGLYCLSCAGGLNSLSAAEYSVVCEAPPDAGAQTNTDTQINEENTSKVDN